MSPLVITILMLVVASHIPSQGDLTALALLEKHIIIVLQISDVNGLLTSQPASETVGRKTIHHTLMTKLLEELLSSDILLLLLMCQSMLTYYVEGTVPIKDLQNHQQPSTTSQCVHHHNCANQEQICCAEYIGDKIVSQCYVELHG